MTIEELQSRRVGVLGFGQEGQATTAYLLRHGIKPVLFDKRALEQFTSSEQALFHEHGLTSHFGADYLDRLAEAEVIFRSPGTWRLVPQLLAAEEAGVIITSQVKWFFEHSPAPIIGVTGTKGKGTTASLIAYILKTANKKFYLTGNVGLDQPLEFLDQLVGDEHIVYELSSFQLQDLTQSPHIAVILMVTNDHLDVHATTEEYHEAKSSIAKFQNTGDIAIINDDYPAAQELGQLSSAKKLFFSRNHQVKDGAYVDGQELLIVEQGTETQRFDLSTLPLRGQHNWENAAAAILAALSVSIEAHSINQALSTFRALPHRLQQLPEQNGIEFYDDSISTVPDTAQAGIRSFTEPLLVLVGGSDKGLDPQPLIDTLVETPNIKAVVTLGATGPNLAQALEDQHFTKPILQGFSDLAAAMKAIKKIAQAGDVVLLSPGFASFGWYNNYKERGNDFARLAADWPNL